MEPSTESLPPVRRILRRWAPIVLAAATFVLGMMVYWAISPSAPPSEEKPAVAVQIQSATIWTCSMHPQIRLPKPGLCPICGMKLIPLETSAEQPASMRQLTVTPDAAALMNIETSLVERMAPTAEIRMVGKVAFDETRLAYITAWVPGRLDRLFVDYTGVAVRKGDHMVYLYSPELLGAQEELIQAAQAVKNLPPDDAGIMRDTTLATLQAVREKLRLWGLTAEQVDEVIRSGKPSDHITIYAPIGGIVIQRNAQEGMYVDTGMKIYTLVDLTHVWVKLDAYESDLAWIRYGQKVKFTTVSYPGETFHGVISFIDPVLDPATRTVKVRVNVPNADGRLKPEMFVKAVVRAQVAAGGRVVEADLAGKWMCPMHPEVLKDGPGNCDICGMPLVRTESLGYVAAELKPSDLPLVIPVSAALVTGTRAVVYLQTAETPKPTFEGLEVVLGPRAGDYYIVRHGLAEGQRVVTRGNFKIDSALQIQAKPSMMTPDGGMAPMSHQHGATAPPAEGPASQPAMEEIPPLVMSQLHAVLSADDEAQKAAAGEDLEKIRAAFAALGKAVAAVEAAALTDHPRRVWGEVSTRLGNDAFEGGSAATLDQARKVADSLANNVRFLQSQLGLEHMGHETPKPAVSPRFLESLAKVLQAYYAVQEALAADDAAKAAAAAARMQQAVQDVPMEELTGADHPAWMRAAASLKDSLASAAQAKQIEPLRQAFALVSEELGALADRFGSPGGKSVYRLHCPMAFDGRGANWLQGDPAVRNPYFGQTMPACGNVVEVIAPAATAQHHDHE